MNLSGSNTNLQRVARAGYIAKGIVYVLLGAMAFMAAFGWSSSGKEASQSGVFEIIRGAPAGGVLLAVLALGLVCYAAWRMIQTFAPQQNGEHKKGKRAAYFFSGLAYTAVAVAAAKMALWNESSGGNSQQTLAASLLQRPFGQWLTGLAAALFAGIGIYQIYYGWAEKYRKHVSNGQLHSQHASLLLRFGKVGYIARGIVWLLIAYLLLQAALHAKASEAGGTADAFSFLESFPAGSYLLGAVGLGLVAYGIFNFIRARYERF